MQLRMLAYLTIFVFTMKLKKKELINHDVFIFYL